MGQSAARNRRRRERETTPQEPPTPEASRAAIQDLIDIWPEGPVVTTKVMDGSFIRAASIWVFAEHAVRTAKAILVLDEQQMYMECGPLARLVFECGTTAAWMAMTPKSGHSIFKGAKRHHDTLIKGMADMSGVELPEEDPDARAGLGDVKEQPSFRQRADFLDGGLWIYRYYRLLSGFSHGEGALVQEYLEEAPADHQFGHRYQFRDPEQFPHRHVVLALTVVMLNFALLSWDHVSEAHGLREPLDRLAKKHRMNSRPMFDRDTDTSGS